LWWRVALWAALPARARCLDRVFMEELALHILDLVENCIAAGAGCVEIRVCERQQEDLLSIEIADDGKGMSADMLQRARDPFFTTKTTRRVGLGLPLFEQAAELAGGEVKIDSRPGVGTRVIGMFKRSHLDRQPLGDIAGTLLALVVGNPHTEFTYVHKIDGSEVSFSTRDLKEQIAGVTLSSPGGIESVRKSLQKVRQHARG
jgi:anti-sigma regulatory factor (Ser/Thr protein kinase)